MKRTFIIILAALLLFALVSCGGEPIEAENPVVSETDEKTETQDPSITPTQGGKVQSAPENTVAAQETETHKETENHMKIIIGENTFTATLADNSTADALVKLLKEGPITIDMRDYANMEKVGPLGTSLPRNDEQITTEPGDLILYQGNALVIYYAPNTWNFTRIGKIDDVTQEELKKALGTGDVSVTISMD